MKRSTDRRPGSAIEARADTALIEGWIEQGRHHVATTAQISFGRVKDSHAPTLDRSANGDVSALSKTAQRRA